MQTSVTYVIGSPFFFIFAENTDVPKYRQHLFRDPARYSVHIYLTSYNQFVEKVITLYSFTPQYLLLSATKLNFTHKTIVSLVTLVSASTMTIILCIHD